MFNSVNNPFNRKIESSTSSDQNKKQHQQDKKEQEKKYLEQEEQDEVRIGGLPILTEDDIKYLVNNYISNLKSKHAEDEKKCQKLDKYLAKFDVKKFMRQNPNITSSDFYMIMYNEVEE